MHTLTHSFTQTQAQKVAIKSNGKTKTTFKRLFKWIRIVSFHFIYPKCAIHPTVGVWNSVCVIWIKWNGEKLHISIYSQRNATETNQNRTDVHFVQQQVIVNSTHRCRCHCCCHRRRHRHRRGRHRRRRRQIMVFFFFGGCCIFLPLFLTKYFINNWLNKRLHCRRHFWYETLTAYPIRFVFMACIENIQKELLAIS